MLRRVCNRLPFLTKPVKGQKMVQNDKKFCPLHFISQEQCIISAVSCNVLGVPIKTVVQPGNLGWHCKPSPVGSRGKTLEIFGYFVFGIAQNIALLALWQGMLTKAYTRNQHFWAFGGLSLGSQTGISPSK